MKGIKIKKLNGSKLRVGIVHSRFNEEYVNSLKDWAIKSLKESKVKSENIKIIEVPGSYELPYGAGLSIQDNVDVVLCLGCLIKGESMHFEYIAEAVSRGLMDLNLQYGVPVIFGVLTCLTEGQAKDRTKNSKENLGYEWAKSAIEMGLLKLNNQKIHKHQECDCGKC